MGSDPQSHLEAQNFMVVDVRGAESVRVTPQMWREADSLLTNHEIDFEWIEDLLSRCCFVLPEADQVRVAEWLLRRSRRKEAIALAAKQRALASQARPTEEGKS